MMASSGDPQNSRKNVILTYDNTRNTDGAGSQCQRIYGTYAVARLLGASYLHTPLHRVDYQGLSALEGHLIDPHFHQRFNDLLKIPSDVAETGDVHHITQDDISVEDFDRFVAMFDAGTTGGRPILAHLGIPFGVADRFPVCYETCKDVSPFRADDRGRRPLRVALHVRRGELLVVESQRMLPNAYYIAAGQHLARWLEQRGIDYRLELHTEQASAPFAVQPGYPGIMYRAVHSVISPAMLRLDEFDVLPHLVPCINDDPIACLRKLATADVLVMSRSSFSYLGGILNRRGVVLYHPFWHHALPSWLIVDSDGQFDDMKFGRAVANWREDPEDDVGRR